MIARIPDFSLLLISSWIEFWIVKFVPKFLNSSTISEDLLSTYIMTSSYILISRHDHILSFINNNF